VTFGGGGGSGPAVAATVAAVAADGMWFRSQNHMCNIQQALHHILVIGH